MAEKYERVLDLMRTKPDGRIEVNDPELLTLLGTLAYRIPTYISCIRRLSKLDVKGIREGRKVVAYQLVALTPDAPATEAAAPATEDAHSDAPATVPTDAHSDGPAPTDDVPTTV